MYFWRCSCVFFALNFLCVISCFASGCRQRQNWHVPMGPPTLPFTYACSWQCYSCVDIHATRLHRLSVFLLHIAHRCTFERGMQENKLIGTVIFLAFSWHQTVMGSQWMNCFSAWQVVGLYNSDIQRHRFMLTNLWHHLYKAKAQYATDRHIDK